MQPRGPVMQSLSGPEESKNLVDNDGNMVHMAADSIDGAAPEYAEIATPSAPGEHVQHEVSAEDDQPREEAAGDLMHGVNSFSAVVWPVCLTMVFARYSCLMRLKLTSRCSIAVVNFQSAALQRSMRFVEYVTHLVFSSCLISIRAINSSYLVYNEVQGAKTSTVVGQSLVNALVVIGFVTALTFLLACLYKFNCMRVCALRNTNIFRQSHTPHWPV